MAATGSLIADLKWAPGGTRASAFPPASRLPRLPPLSDEEGTPPPPQIRKTPSARYPNANSGFAMSAGRPRRRVKLKGGAPRGNRNAQKSGCHTLALREFRRALGLYVRALKAQVAQARAAIPRQPQRSVYTVIRPDRCYVRTRCAALPRQLGDKLADALQPRAAA